MTLKELLLAVKEKNLTKEELEGYRDDLSYLFAQMQLEMANIEKEEALYPQENFKSAIERKTSWKSTPSGQRLIELKRYCLATKEILNSLKSRLFNYY